MARSEKQPLHTVSLKGYVIGFVLSLLLTLVAFLFVSEHVTSGHGQPSHQVIVPLLAVFALSQFVVQMVFFLHLGTDRAQRWKLLVFWFMIVIVLILVVGSLWIMQNLNYNMMSPAETTIYMRDHEGF